MCKQKPKKILNHPRMGYSEERGIERDDWGEVGQGAFKYRIIHRVHEGGT